ncbi:hypothetical protein OQA88_4475 [Cercophora sp. LCS_1]
MARQQNRKRPRADDLPQEHRPGKKIRSEDGLKKSSNFSPEFWDNLSKVLLTPRALRELDRRNNAQPITKPPSPAVYIKDLARFARCGGPDLRHLRGCPEPKNVGSQTASSSSSSRRTMSTKAAARAGKGGKASAYGAEFETHLTDHSIYPEGYEYPEGRSTPEPDNLVHRDLFAARASLSPSCFSASKFQDFKRKDARATFENDVMTTVVPIICGDADIPSKQNVLFTELAPVTSTYKDVVRPKPDLFDGAHIRDLDGKVRDRKGDIYPLTIPTKHASVPVVPNFFLEVKAPHGTADVLKRQACYNGTYGARAMHALQNYGKEEPTYDGDAYTYSSTYFAGALKLYAHHVTAPTDPEGRPEYHMTQVRAYSLTSDLETCVAGIGAFRNARDLAKRHRDTFIQEVNARARRSAVLQVNEPSQASPSIDVVETSMSFAASSTSSSSPQSQAHPKRRAPRTPPQPHKERNLVKRRTQHSAPRRSASSAASPNI